MQPARAEPGRESEPAGGAEPPARRRRSWPAGLTRAGRGPDGGGAALLRPSPCPGEARGLCAHCSSDPRGPVT